MMTKTTAKTNNQNNKTKETIKRKTLLHPLSESMVKKIKQYINKKLTFEQYCTVRDLEYKKSGSYKTKIKEFDSQYFRFDDTCKEMNILEIYPPEERRWLEYKQKYLQTVQNVLLARFCKEKQQIDPNTGKPFKSITLSYNEMYQEFCMVSEHNWKPAKHYPESILYLEYFKKIYNKDLTENENYRKIKTENKVFVTVADRTMKRIINDSIKRLENQKFIIASDTYRLVKTINEIKEIDENTGEEIATSRQQEIHDCTDSENERVLKAFRNVMKNWIAINDDGTASRVSSWEHIYTLNYQQKENFFGCINQSIKEEFEDKWDFAYRCKKFLIMDGLDEEYVVEFFLDKMNNSIIDRFTNTKELDCLSMQMKDIFIENYIKYTAPRLLIDYKERKIMR